MNDISVTFPTVEAAVSALCEKVFGAPWVATPDYRMLEAGEMIERDDEWFDDKWVPVTECIGDHLWSENVGVFRRPLFPTIEQARAENAANNIDTGPLKAWASDLHKRDRLKIAIHELMKYVDADCYESLLHGLSLEDSLPWVEFRDAVRDCYGEGES